MQPAGEDRKRPKDEEIHAEDFFAFGTLFFQNRIAIREPVGYNNNISNIRGRSPLQDYTSDFNFFTAISADIFTDNMDVSVHKRRLPMQNGETQRNSFNREIKSSTFTAYFGTPEHAADLYRGLEHSENVGPEDIMFTTLQGVMFMARKNDLAFTARKKVLVIGEHQSTVNQNMPLRNAIYFGRTVEMLIPPREIYRANRLMIPTPEFYSFYNGRTDQPAEKILKLSDSYLENTGDPMLELTVREININPSVNHPLLHRSRSVFEYSTFIQRIRDYIDSGEAQGTAIAYAMEDCIRDDVMTDFINRHGSEVRNMLFTEFNLEDAKEVWAEEAREEGELLSLISMVQKKVKRNKPLSVIVEELEESEEKLRPIYETVLQRPDETKERIYRELMDHRIIF